MVKTGNTIYEYTLTITKTFKRELSIPADADPNDYIEDAWDLVYQGDACDDDNEEVEWEEVGSESAEDVRFNETADQEYESKRDNN